MKRLLLVIVALAVLGALVWSFLASRKEAAQEAESERPVKAPTRVAVVNGATVITVDEASRRASGIETVQVTPAQYRQEVRAYGAVLELTRLTELFNSYVLAKAEAQTARAKLAASRTAFERARTLYKEDQNVSLARVQEAEAAFRSDEATVSASESRAETLAATARQEWGAVLAKALVERDGLITRLMERKEVLLQVTLPPDVVLARPPATAGIQTGKQGRATARLVSGASAYGSEDPGRELLLRRAFRRGTGAGNERGGLPRARRDDRRRGDSRRRDRVVAGPRMDLSALRARCVHPSAYRHEPAGVWRLRSTGSSGRQRGRHARGAAPALGGVSRANPRGGMR